MKRRAFIKTSSAIAAGAGLATTFAAGCGNTENKKANARLLTEHPPKVLQSLENDYLKVVIYSDGSADIDDK